MPKEPAKTPLSERLQEVLDDHGWSKSERSERAGLSREMVGQLMRGDLKGNSGVATTPQIVYARATEEWAMPSEGEIRRGRLTRMPGVQTVQITDARRRVAFLVR